MTTIRVVIGDGRNPQIFNFHVFVFFFSKSLNSDILWFFFKWCVFLPFSRNFVFRFGENFVSLLSEGRFCLEDLEVGNREGLDNCVLNFWNKCAKISMDTDRRSRRTTKKCDKIKLQEIELPQNYQHDPNFNQS